MKPFILWSKVLFCFNALIKELWFKSSLFFQLAVFLFEFRIAAAGARRHSVSVGIQCDVLSAVCANICAFARLFTCFSHISDLLSLITDIFLPCKNILFIFWKRSLKLTYADSPNKTVYLYHCSNVRQNFSLLLSTIQ